jgi:hypothetical protein
MKTKVFPMREAGAIPRGTGLLRTHFDCVPFFDDGGSEGGGVVEGDELECEEESELDISNTL